MTTNSVISKAAEEKMSSNWKNKNWRRKIERVLRRNHIAIGKTLKNRAAEKRKKSGFLGPRFKKAKRLCWVRSKGKCKACRNKIPKGIQRTTHHVNFNKKDNRQRNLIALCRKCHWIYHTLLKFIPLIELYPRKARNYLLKGLYNVVRKVVEP